MSLKDHSAITPSNVPSGASANESKPVVLVVGDYLNARPDLKEALTRKGCSVIDTDNGLDATEQARESRPDLLLVDMDVPLLYELMVARKIVKNAVAGPLPVVIVTHECVVDPMPFLELGADRNEYVTRLSDYAELQPLLDYLLPVLPRTDHAGPMLQREPIAVSLPSVLFD